MTPATYATAVLALAAWSLPVRAEIVVIVHPSNPAARMLSEQAAQFFLGKSTLFMPIDQADGSAIRAEFYLKCAGKDTNEVKAIWSKIVFTGKGVPPKVFATSADIRKAVAASPRAIAYIDKSALDDSVKAILTLP
jgi:ABC-type phosphate transport system substrate-binding protein